MARSPEEKWFRRLERCLKDMPKTVEITVRAYGSICMHEAGATEAYFQAHGDPDNAPEIASFQADRVRGEESSI